MKILVGHFLLVSKRIDALVLTESCRTQLEQLGSLLDDYAILHDGQYPAELYAPVISPELLQRKSQLLKLLSCPAKKAPDDFGVNSYCYRGEGLSVSSNKRLVLVHDRHGNHGQRRNVLFTQPRTEYRVGDRRVEEREYLAACIEMLRNFDKTILVEFAECREDISMPAAQHWGDRVLVPLAESSDDEVCRFCTTLIEFLHEGRLSPRSISIWKLLDHDVQERALAAIEVRVESYAEERFLQVIAVDNQARVTLNLSPIAAD
ncbi:MAG: hypothetical protein IH624_18255 [Phycisphaerae bacterium]|nr:hypothetical protein [Phycisphaerae bacterium]